MASSERQPSAPLEASPHANTYYDDLVTRVMRVAKVFRRVLRII